MYTMYVQLAKCFCVLQIEGDLSRLRLGKGQFKGAEKQGQDSKSSFSRQVASDHLETVKKNPKTQVENNSGASLCKI